MLEQNQMWFITLKLEILSTKLLIKKQDKGLCRLTTKQPLENL
jgi:hypothetical protein